MPNNGQFERTNHRIKEGEVEQKTIPVIVSPLNVTRFHHDRHDRLRAHLTDFNTAYNFSRRLKSSAASRNAKKSAKSGHPGQTDSFWTRSARGRNEQMARGRGSSIGFQYDRKSFGQVISDEAGAEVAGCCGVEHCGDACGLDPGQGACL